MEKETFACPDCRGIVPDCPICDGSGLITLYAVDPELSGTMRRRLSAPPPFSPPPVSDRRPVQVPKPKSRTPQHKSRRRRRSNPK